MSPYRPPVPFEKRVFLVRVGVVLVQPAAPFPASAVAPLEPAVAAVWPVRRFLLQQPLKLFHVWVAVLPLRVALVTYDELYKLLEQDVPSKA